MPTAFLSHSSTQKPFVEEVARQLKSSAKIDSQSFEFGMLSEEEILNLIPKCDLFVIFLSEEALSSKWVEMELIKAKELLDKNLIKRIFPVIIDKRITFRHPDIPVWLKEDYNLQPVLRTGVLFRSIKNRLREISWEKHPNLKERERIFVGRNDELKLFEERLDDIDKVAPMILICSGLPKIGRKRLLKEVLIKTSIVNRESTDHALISIDSTESIEDFYLKIYDLGFSSEKKTPDFFTLSISDKINLLSSILVEIEQSKEIIFIEDNGGIIQHQGSVSNWFLKVIQNLNNNKVNRVFLCISSQYRLNPRTVDFSPDFFHVGLTVLSTKEQTGLLKRLLALFDLDLKHDELLSLISNFDGFPDQIHFAVDYISNNSIREALNNSIHIKDYNNSKLGAIISKIESDEVFKNILSILVEFEFISFSLIYEFFPETEPKDLDNIINSLHYQSVLDFIGSRKDYFKLNFGIKSFLRRSGYKIEASKNELLKKHIKDFLEKDEIPSSDLSDYFFSLRGALQANYKLKNNLLVPSHYLKSMINLYEKENNYKMVISLGHQVLEHSNKIDIAIIYEVKYWLCLSLARLRDPKFLDEVQSFKRDSEVQYHFLLGFYYRQNGNFSRALSSYENSLRIWPKYNKARREKVQVLIALDQFDEAFEEAKLNYETNKNNLFHIQAYFDTLIRQSRPWEHKETLKYLLTKLQTIHTIKANEMYALAMADYSVFIENDSKKAIEQIDTILNNNRNYNYLIKRKFDIVEKAGLKFEMKKILEELEKGSLSNPLLKNQFWVMKSKYEAHTGNLKIALQLIDIHLNNYPENTRSRLKNYLRLISGRY